MAKTFLSDSDSDVDLGGVEVDGFKVNTDYAKRFEHNKKREELQRLEEKLGKSSRKRKRQDDENTKAELSDEDSESSSSEEEDEDGQFATEALDAEISATLNAIRSKDPRVYDKDAKFYTDFDPDSVAPKATKEKPVYLQDYHRENLLNNGNGNVKEEDQPLSYNQEQERLKKSVIGAMQAAANNGSDPDADSGSEDDFMVAKEKPQIIDKSEASLGVENAHKDPETFLSNFMASRAWIPTDRSEMHAFESDDEEEDNRAEDFEEAYNLRFEDPEKSNERLRTHARDVAAKYSARRDEKSSRQKKRDIEKQKKEDAKQQLKEDKARLKRLRMEEVQEKVRRIKRAAGLKSSDIRPEDWAHFVDDEWDDDKWEAEMKKRFDDDYYQQEDVESEDANENGETSKKRRKPKKPKFDDDIDINDIVPDFVENEDTQFSVSEDDEQQQEQQISNKKKHKKLKEEKQQERKKEQRIIEQLVEDQLKYDLETSRPNAKTAGFRYRETSPNSFGLTSRDILLAEDTQLNEFAGLKKLAAFREAEKKQKDKARLGKKARLRKWRKDTFGDEEGLQNLDLVPKKEEKEDAEDIDNEEGGVNIITAGKKKRRRGKKQKGAVA